MNYTITHSGIKGMKWGVRRYTNEDGTLTDEGRIRYGHRQAKGMADKRLHQNTTEIDQAARYRDQDRAYKEQVAADKKYLEAKQLHDTFNEKRKEAAAIDRHEDMLEAKAKAKATAEHEKRLKAKNEAYIKAHIPASAWNQRVRELNK